MVVRLIIYCQDKIRQLSAIWQNCFIHFFGWYRWMFDFARLFLYPPFETLIFGNFVYIYLLSQKTVYYALQRDARSTQIETVKPTLTMCIASNTIHVQLSTNSILRLTVYNFFKWVVFNLFTIYWNKGLFCLCL